MITVRVIPQPRITVGSFTPAEQSAIEAAASAAAAAVSASQADSAATLATEQATLASGARNDAEAAKIAAEGFADDAEGFKDDAEAAAAQAAQSAQDAQAAKVDAEAAAGAAEGFKDDAEAAEQSAQAALAAILANVATFTIDLTGFNETIFYAPQDLRINSFTAIVGNPTQTLIRVNNVNYTLGNLVTQGSAIYVFVEVGAVLNLSINYE